MNKAILAVGDPVRVVAGVYAGSEGVIDDLHPECSAVRLTTDTGNAYALIGTMERIVKPVPSMPRGKPILKK